MIRARATNDAIECVFCSTSVDPQRAFEFLAKPVRSARTLEVLGDCVDRIPWRTVRLCGGCAPFVRRLGRHGRLYLEVSVVDVNGQRVTAAIAFRVRRKLRGFR
jgi:hypothetical protein